MSNKIRPDEILIKILQTYQDRGGNQLFVSQLPDFIDALKKGLGEPLATEIFGWHRSFKWISQAIAEAEGRSTVVKLLDGKIMTTPIGVMIADKISLHEKLDFVLETTVTRF